MTEEPARVHGISHEVGSLAPGRLADLVLWEASSFGVKPVMVFKGGVVAWSAIGEGNASVHGAQPTRYGPDWGATGVAPARGLHHVRVGGRRSTPGIARTGWARGGGSSPCEGHALDPSRRPRPEPDRSGDRGLASGRNRDPGRAGAANRSRRQGALCPAATFWRSDQSRFRIASAAISKYSSNARTSRVGWLHRVDGRPHVEQPAIPLTRTDGERRVPHPEAWVSALVVVGRGPAPVLREEQGQVAGRRARGPPDTAGGRTRSSATPS